MNSRSFFTTVLSLFTLTAVAACSVQRQLDDMHDKTSQMADTTKRMSDTTSQMDRSTDDLDKLTRRMNKTTSNMNLTTMNTYADLRIGATKDARDKQIRTLIDSPQMPQKLQAASAYFYAFEFQYWKRVGDDNETKLNDMKDLAAKEFLETIQMFQVHHYSNDFKPLSDELKNFYALSAVSHFVYPNELELSRVDGFEPASIYSILEEGLRALAERPDWNPADMPAYIKDVQHFKEVAEAVVQARVDYIPFQAWAEMRNINPKSDAGVFGQAIHDQFGWNLNLYGFTAAQISEYGEYLMYALTSRKLLTDIGVKSELDNSFLRTLKIKDIWSHVHFVNRPMKTDSASATQLKKTEIDRFEKFLSLLLAPQDVFRKADPSIYTISPTLEIPGIQLFN